MMGLQSELIYLATLRPSVRATSASALTVGTGAKAFVLLKDIWFAVPGDLVVDRKRGEWKPVYPQVGETVTADDGAGRAMTGTVTGYVQATKTLTVNVVSTVGSGTGGPWTITGLVTLRYCTGKGLVTRGEGHRPGPAGTIYEGCLKAAPSFSRHIFARGSTFGLPERNFGALLFSNADGHLDHLRMYSFALRDVALQFGMSDARLSEYADFVAAVGEEMLFSWRDATLRLRDTAAKLNLPIQTEKYRGDNAPETPDPATKSPGTLASDSAAGSSAWNDPSNAAAADAAYASAAGVGFQSQYLKMTNFGFSVGGTPTGVLVQFERHGVGAAISDAAVRLVVGGVPVGTTVGSSLPWPASDTVVNYGGPADLWGLALTAAQVNAADFGVMISVAGDPGSLALIDAVAIEVRWSGGASYQTKAPGTAANDASVGTVAWVNPNNARLSDSAYATASSPAMATQYLKVTNFGFDVADVVPAAASIVGVVAKVKRNRSSAGGGVVDSVVKLVVGGVVTGDNKANAAVWPTSDEIAVYGSSGDVWGVTTLTAAQVRASDFGVVLSATGVEGQASLASVDHIEVLVYFDAGPVVMGVEGGIEFKGVLKPLGFGRIFNAAPDLVNAQQGIYKMAAGLPADRKHLPLAVRDRGVALTQPNRVPTPDLSGSTGWTLGAGWTISGGKLKHAAGSASECYCTLTGALAAASPHILGFHQLIRSGSGFSVRLQTDLAAFVWVLNPTDTDEGFVEAYIADGIDPSTSATTNWRLAFAAYANSDLDIDLVNYTPVPDYATEDLLQAATPTPGGFSTCLSGALLKLGSLPAGQVTCDFTYKHYATPASFVETDWRVGQVVEQILAGPGGLVSGTDFSAADIAALKARYSAAGDTCAVYMPAADNSPTIGQVLSALLQPLLYWHLPDRAGVLEFKAVDDALAGAADFSIGEGDILDLAFLVPADPGEGAPMKALTYGSHPNATLQPDAALAGDKTSVNDSVGGLTVRGLYGRAFRTTVWPEKVAGEDVAAETTFVAAHHKMAYELSVNAAVNGRATAQGARDRMVALRKIKRDMLQVTVPMDPMEFASRRPGARGSINSDRFGLDQGKVFLVLGEDIDASRRRHTLVLWG